MTVADYIVKFLAERGVSHVFELSGGMITPLLDAVDRHGSPTLVDMRHEQAAGFAAEGMARMTGVPGVAFATSGPGASNLMTAIASCYFDSVPAIFITGQVSTVDGLQGGGRQCGFQETDIVTMATPVTKGRAFVNAPSDVANSLSWAWSVATRKRPGPVLLDIPFNVLRAEMAEASIDEPYTYGTLFDSRLLDDVIRKLRDASRPLVLVGGGVRSANAINSCRVALNHLWLPVVHSLQGLDVTYTGHPLRVGMIGSYGNRWANWALAKSDTILVLGSRLDIRQTGADVDAFVKGKTIIRVDIDRLEDRVPSDLFITAQLHDFCNALVAHGENPGAVNAYGFAVESWKREIAGAEPRWTDVTESNAPPGTVNPNAFMHHLGAAFEDAAAFVLDVGAHQMWAAQSLRFLPGQRVLSSGGLGAMGFALPAAIGACLASNRKQIVVITGDGGLQVNMQELQTIVEWNLPIKIIVMNNRGHGMVRQFQREVFGGRMVATNPSAPDFVAIARAYGIQANVTHDLNRSMIEGMARIPGPALLEVTIDPTTRVYPKLAYGRHLDDMEGKP